MSSRSRRRAATPWRGSRAVRSPSRRRSNSSNRNEETMMTTTTEARQVLEMLSQGKVSVQEAEQLLQAVASGEAADPKVPANPKYFRIQVSKPAMDGKKAEN